MPILSEYNQFCKADTLNADLKMKRNRGEQMPLITLRAARVNCGFRLREVADYCEKSVDTIIKYEKNSNDIPHDLMKKLLELYGVTIDEIFFGLLSDFIGQHKARIEKSA